MQPGTLLSWFCANPPFHIHPNRLRVLNGVECLEAKRSISEGGEEGNEEAGQSYQNLHSLFRRPHFLKIGNSIHQLGAFRFETRVRAEAVFGLWKSRHGGRGRSLKYFASPLQSVPFSSTTAHHDWAKKEGGGSGEADFTLRHGSQRSLYSAFRSRFALQCRMRHCGGGVDRWSEDGGMKE